MTPFRRATDSYTQTRDAASGPTETASELVHWQLGAAQNGGDVPYLAHLDPPDKRGVLMLLDSTRQQFLAAWRAAVPHLPASVAGEEITSTTNAMRGLVDLEGNPNDRG